MCEWDGEGGGRRKACLGSRGMITGRNDDGRRTFAGLPGPTDGFGDHTGPLRLKKRR